MRLRQRGRLEQLIAEFVPVVAPLIESFLGGAWDAPPQAAAFRLD